MPKGKFKTRFDYRSQRGGKMTSYPAGYESDDIPQSHFDAAVAAGAIEGEQPKPEKTK